jgi:DNA-binding LacI/PurR family transcriptional regulator/DNA-binding transcriptional regulator YhcF (GntR family)
MTVANIEGGPAAAELAAGLRKNIESGDIAAGEFLPSVRRLSRERSLAHKTVYHALRTLAAEGFVSAEPGRGYRVLARANDPHRGCPVSYVLSSQLVGEDINPFYTRLMAELQGAAGRQGWSLLGVGTSNMTPAKSIEQCVASRSWGLIVETHGSELIARALKAGFAVVMIDSWSAGAGVDAVIQDGFGGGFTAAEYLAGRDRKRIAWFGPATLTVHGRSRFGGAVSGLLENGLALAPELIVDAREGDTFEAARRLLSGRNRPDAVLALSPSKCVEIARAAKELGLAPGEDIDLVGWSADEFEPQFAADLPAGWSPPRITWSMRTLVNTAMERLAERRERPDLPAMRINIETRLKTG